MDELLNSYVSFPRFFTVSDLSWLIEPFEKIEDFEKAIGEDNRFIKVGENNGSRSVYIPKKTLFYWLASLNYDLAKAGVHRLSSQKLSLLLSTPRISGKWEKTPKKIVDFGQKYGLIVSAWSKDQYVFPLSRVMLSLSPNGAKVLHNYLYFLEDWDSFANQDLSKLILESLKFFDDRTLQIIFEREGLLDGSKKTLEEIGKQWRITRERVRQIEEKFWIRVFHPARNKILIEPFLCDFIKRRGSLFIDLNDNEALWRIFIAKCTKIPMKKLHEIVVLLTPDSEEIECFENPIKFFNKEMPAEDLAYKIESDYKPCYSRQELWFLCKLAGKELQDELKKRKEKITKRKKVYYSLRSLGRPAHYSEVYEKYLKLFPKDNISENSVHSILNYQKHNIVWVGKRGTYALKVWGYQRPKKSLFDTVSQIVNKFYKLNKKPVPLTTIASELGKHRRVVNYASLYFATYFNKELECVRKDFFIPKKFEKKGKSKAKTQSLDRALRKFKDKLRA